MKVGDKYKSKRAGYIFIIKDIIGKEIIGKYQGSKYYKIFPIKVFENSFEKIQK